MASKPNEGALFANKDKTTDAHPNARGEASIGGVEYWVSAWTNVGQQSGERYQKLKFTKKDRQAEDRANAVPPQDTGAPFNDDIPF
jgi:hypothetical protein